jgi:hypothetical protein
MGVFGGLGVVWHLYFGIIKSPPPGVRESVWNYFNKRGEYDGINAI